MNKCIEDVSQSFQSDLDIIDYRLIQSMSMKLTTVFESNVINNSFKSARNIAKKAAKKINFLVNTDILPLTNASFVLFSKMHEQNITKNR